MSYDWHGLLTPWSTALIEAGEAEDISVPPEVAASGWLGYPGATEAQLAAAEARLGTRLPPSYRQFLSVTNGWRQTGSFVYRLWSTEEIAWFRVRHQGWIDAYTGPHDGDREPLPDEEYFVYGEAQDPVKFRAEHLRTALEISDRGDAAIYLLNPQIVTPEGEWEAWFFANWLPGARRYRSFWELMQGEYRSFRRLRAHDAKRMRKQDALTQLPGKLPGLIDELLQKAQFYRWASTKQGGLHRAYDRGLPRSWSRSPSKCANCKHRDSSQVPCWPDYAPWHKQPSTSISRRRWRCAIARCIATPLGWNEPKPWAWGLRSASLGGFSGMRPPCDGLPPARSHG